MRATTALALTSALVGASALAAGAAAVADRAPPRAVRGSPWPPSAFASASAALATMNITQKLAAIHGWLGD
jgi:beta-glucosidase